jgi:hypothetical protein
VILQHDTLSSGLFELKLAASTFLVPGEQVGLSAGRCAIAAFKQTQGRQDAWYLGNIILADYYMVFDMTPQSEHGEGFVQIGFAQMNPAGLQY